MKKILNYILVLGALTAAVITGCTEQNPSEGLKIEVTSVKASAASAEVVLTTSGIISYAYVCLPEAEAAPANEAIIYASGVEHPMIDGANTITVYAGNPLTSYVAYFAFKNTDGMFNGEIVKVPFTTTDYQDIITVTGATLDGYSVHIEMPQDVLERGNRLRYMINDIAGYNMVKYYGVIPMPDASSLVYGENELNSSIDLTYNNDNIYAKDENGNEIVDENGDYIMHHEPIAPGEPSYVVVGEFGLGESPYGYGEGYYDPLFDFNAYNNRIDKGDKVEEGDYWTGTYKRVLIFSSQPSPLDAELNIEITPGATRANMKFTPGEGVDRYCFTIMPHAEYIQLVDNFLEGHEEYLQWYVTSFTANYQFIAPSYTEAVEVDAASFIYMNAETDYHLLAVAMGDEYGSTQRFYHEVFTTTPKQMDAPVINVTPIPSDDPYSVTFNIKAPNADLIAASYIAHYESEIKALLNNGMTFNDIISSNGNQLQPIEVAAINSPEGYTVSFSTRDDESTILAIRGMNIEDTYNDITGLDDPAVGTCTSPALPDKAPVDSDLFTALEGEWVATFEVFTPGSTGKPVATQRTIELFNSIEYPETLPEEVYETYESLGFDRKATDEFYTEFKEEAEYYTAKKLKGQNRMVGVGFGIADIPAAAPYDLFINEEANFSTVESIFYQFGPKWYLQIESDGTVNVPMNMTKLPSASYWCLSAEFYLIGVNGTHGVIYEDLRDSSEDGFFYFPVEVSEDRSTITIKPIEIDGIPYYMNIGYQMAYSENWYFYLSQAICSDIVLTRGDQAEAVAASVPATANAVSVPTSSISEGVSVEKAVRMERTALKEDAIKYKKVEYTIPTLEDFEAAMFDKMTKRNR